jgi:gluconate 5-dehydrogenase
MPSLSCFDLTGKGIGLTGGGGHLGRALALGLVEAGAVVVIGSRNVGPLASALAEAKSRNLPGRLITQVTDITDRQSVASMIAGIQREAGQVDGWINNAYSGSGGLLLDATFEQVQHTLTVGFTATFQALQLAAQAMIPKQKGSIVNVASMYGCVSPQPATYRTNPQLHNPPAYGAVKAALIQLTRYAACHLAGQGIRVNAISPGPFPSAPVQENQAFMRELEARVPLGRIGRPQELVGATVFLLSDASSFVTGHNLVVDGGWTTW